MQEPNGSMKAKLTITEFLYEQTGEFRSDKTPFHKPSSEKLAKWKVYAAEHAKGNPPILLLTLEPMKLGDWEGTLRKCTDWDRKLFPEELLACALAKPYPLEKTEIYAECKFNKVNGKTADWHETIKNRILPKGIYEPGQKLTISELQDIGEEKIMEYIDLHICGNYDVDPRIVEWGKTGLIKFPIDDSSTRWMKYRDHALIIKNSKSGVTAISRRTNANIDQLTEASAEGWTDGKGNIRYSVFHEDYHAKNIDEVLQVNENIMSTIYSFMETGEYNSVKAAYQIKNRGAPKITFTANPSTLHRNIEEGSTYETNDALGAFAQVLSHLTSTPEAAMSRFGRVIFANNIKRATERETIIPEEIKERANDAITSLMSHIKPMVAEIYAKNETWLNCPITGYGDRIRATIKGYTDSAVLYAWTGQEGAYRHIRGGALASAIVDNAYKIMIGTATNEEIIEDAEAEVQNIIERNLESLGNLVAANKIALTSEKIKMEIETIEPRWYRPLLYCIYGVPKETVTLPEMEDFFNTIPEDERLSRFGQKYAYWSQIASKLTPRSINMVSNRLSLRFGLIIHTSASLPLRVMKGKYFLTSTITPITPITLVLEHGKSKPENNNIPKQDINVFTGKPNFPVNAKNQGSDEGKEGKEGKREERERERESKRGVIDGKTMNTEYCTHSAMSGSDSKPDINTNSHLPNSVNPPNSIIMERKSDTMNTEYCTHSDIVQPSVTKLNNTWYNLKPKVLLIVKDIPTFVGTDGRRYGAFEAGAVFEFPGEVADLIISRGFGVVYEDTKSR